MLGLLKIAWPAAALLLSASHVEAKTRDGRLHPNLPPRPLLPIEDVPQLKAFAATPVTSRNGTVLPPYDTTYYFDQLIDHNNPSLGTFKQRYWHTYEWYERGGPIVLMTPGETNAAPYTAYLTNRTLNGQLAQAQSGTTILLEHRYFGLSNPFDDLSSASMRFHTIQQAIDDLEYFAKNVKLPQPDGDSVAPGQAPWVLIGGSYAGALTSFTMVNKPNLFQAAYSSSGVVESILDFWGYFTPIMEHMPKNCSADVQAAIAHIDKAFMSKDEKETARILQMFDMTTLADHLDDVVGALRNILWEWQNLTPSSGGGTFFEFCDALEVKNGVSAGPEGWGLDHALQAWATYWTETYYPRLCDDVDAATCLGTYDQDFWTDPSVDNSWRSWYWIVCNEVGFFQSGAPLGQPTIATRLLEAAYHERLCKYMFPEAFEHLGEQLPVPDVAATNKAYHGWFVQEKHLFFANGIRDPWREATKAASGTNFPSTPDQPLAVSDGYHCSDLSTAHGNADATVKAVQQQALTSIAGWLAEWKPSGAHAQ